MIQRVLFFILSVIIGLPAFAVEKQVYLLEINDEIGAMTWQHTRRACQEAKESGADILLLHLNTYGGTVEHADSIRTSLLNFPCPVIAFIDNNAASAGALIALACDSVYMRPGASMGAATVVNQNAEAMPDKYQSYMRAMMRATAESHGKTIVNDDTVWVRDPLIAEAMVDPRVVVPGLIDSTKVLTFTSQEAIKWGYCEGEATSVEDVLDKCGATDYEITQFEATWIDWLIGFFSNPAVQAVLIMHIVWGLYFELHSPGMGFPSAIAITSAVLYFLPLYITGIASSWIIILFVVGLILLVFEIFVIPGQGVAGILGAIAMFAALVGGLLEGTSPSEIEMSDLFRALAIVGSGTVLAVILIFYLTSSRFGPKFVRKHSELQASQLVEDGYIGVDMTPTQHIGKTAKAVTDMRLGGKIEIDGVIYDAVSISEFITAGSMVKVVKYENSQLYVTINE